MDNLMDKGNHFAHKVAHRFTHSTRFCPQAPQGQVTTSLRIYVKRLNPLEIKIVSVQAISDAAMDLTAAFCEIERDKPRKTGSEPITTRVGDAFRMFTQLVNLYVHQLSEHIGSPAE